MNKLYQGYIFRIGAVPFDLPILVNGALQKTVRQGYRLFLVIAKDHGSKVGERIFHPEGVCMCTQLVLKRNQKDTHVQ